MAPRRRWVPAAVVVTGALALAGCSGDDGADTAEPATTSIVEPPTSTEAPLTTEGTSPAATASPTLPAAPNQVRIVDYAFEPETIEVGVGDAVTWVNDDVVDHWVVTTSGDAIDSATLEPGNSYAETFDEPGTYAYFCNIHNVMTGTVVVR